MRMIENAVKVLNELLEADPEATNEFFRLKTIVNTLVCDHPTIQVLAEEKLSPLYGILRPLGLINGLFKEDDKVIIMILDESGTKIIEFGIGILKDGRASRYDKGSPILHHQV